ncbi:Transcription factor PDR1 [Fusarium oxysporum f. sp. raphani]|uniref:Transcription factor PDR1 n=1 Tax=Fusarium oxysporum f. sp. raphani TaxID=96318 RepID=A0A8J5NLF5_FUSOX|nr:Transcription factor PDR1 [Fusarium oxysporum f. sp. raphani]
MPPLRAIASRACDGCRRRKVKCDTLQPCANCRISRLACEYTVSARKRGPKVAKLTDATVENLTAPRNTVSLTPQQSPPSDVSTRTQQDQLSLWRLVGDKSSPVIGPLDPCRLFRQIHDNLLLSIRMTLSSVDILDIVSYCIDLYMQYTFPTAPLVHEPSLRASAVTLFGNDALLAQFDEENEEQRVAHMRVFALVTALCASVSCIMPEYLLPYGQLITAPFFQASREMLSGFGIYDLEYPSSSSLVTRVFHSTVFQHTTGKTGAAWHVYGHAALLAQSLRLYSEQSVLSHGPVESCLLRMNFWHLYMSDKAASAMRTRPYLLDESTFDEALTLEPYPPEHVLMFDPGRVHEEDTFQARILTGFHLYRRIWSTGASLLRQIQTYQAAQPGKDVRPVAREYQRFMGMLDNLPSWLRISDIVNHQDDTQGSLSRKSSFWVQRSTIMVTFYCLGLIALQQCIDDGVCEVAGFSDGSSTLLSKKIDMIQNFVQTLEDIPFLYLQVKGEPNVST